MTALDDLYAVVTSDGYQVFTDPVAALQYAAYMVSVGSDSVFFVAYEIDGKTKFGRRLTIYDMKKALHG